MWHVNVGDWSYKVVRSDDFFILHSSVSLSSQTNNKRFFSGTNYPLFYRLSIFRRRPCRCSLRLTSTICSPCFTAPSFSIDKEQVSSRVGPIVAAASVRFSADLLMYGVLSK